MQTGIGVSFDAKSASGLHFAVQRNLTATESRAAKGSPLVSTSQRERAVAVLLAPATALTTTGTSEVQVMADRQYTATIPLFPLSRPRSRSTALKRERGAS